MTERFFNTAGPVRPEDHYCLPPLARLDLAEILSLIAQQKYFVLHAPRQTGKTSCLLALMQHLNEGGQYRSLYVNIEGAQSAREDVRRGIRSVLSEIDQREQYHLREQFFSQRHRQIVEDHGEDHALNVALGLWARASDKPISSNSAARSDLIARRASCRPARACPVDAANSACACCGSSSQRI